MRVLVVGGGGREHALAWKLSQEDEVFSAPGNPGIAQIAETFPVRADNEEGMVALCEQIAPEVVLVGPENPLLAGLGDRLRARGVSVFGPSAAAAALEGSKAWAKEQMLVAGVPTAHHQSFRDFDAAVAYAASRFDGGRQVAVKASGAALGKGVVVAQTHEEARDALEAMLVDREHGEAGATVVVEDALVGREFSLLALVSETEVRCLPVAQDYKRALDGDHGPNTGGMGSVSPVSWLTEDLVARAEREVIVPIVRHLAAQGLDYRGCLFAGLLVEDGTPYCLEYNVRFGDPETQSIVRRLGPGFAQAILDVAEGRPIGAIEVTRDAAVSVVVASGGYPGTIETGFPIDIGPMPEGVEIFHAGTASLDGCLVTAGGRVFAVSAVGSTVADARERAYAGGAQVGFAGAWCRRDIGACTKGQSASRQTD